MFYNIKSSVFLFNVNTIDIGTLNLRGGGLQRLHQMPGAYPPSETIKYVCRHCQRTPGRQN